MNTLPYRKPPIIVSASTGQKAAGRWPGRAVFWLYLVIAAYFFVLPLGNVPLFGSTDIRLYDMLIIIGYLLFFLPNINVFWYTIKTHAWLRFFVILCGWSTLTIMVTYTWGNSYRALLAGVYIFRFFSFGMVAAALLIFIQDRKHLIGLTHLFYYMCLIQGVLALMQSLNIIPSLWPSYWSYYGERPVGTLGPNHIHSGGVAALGVGVGLVLMSYHKHIMQRLFYGIGLVLIAYMAVLTESRTGWLGLVSVLLFYILFSIGNRRMNGLLVILLVAFSVWMVVLVSGDRVNSLLYESFQNRFAQSELETGLAGVDRYRSAIWQAIPSAIARNSWILLSGAGAMNSVKVLSVASSAHNNYAHVLIEAGIIGLVCYLRMLYAIWQQGREMMKSVSDVFGKNLVHGFLAIFSTILILNLTSEFFYMQPATFSLSGQIFILVALALHPLWKQDLPELTPKRFVR